MANATSGSITFTVTPNNAVAQALQGNIVGAPSSPNFYAGVQSIATSSTALNIGTLSGPGPLMIKNLDSTNYVEVDANSSFNGFPQKIPAGQSIFLWPETDTIYLKANTGAVLVQVLFANS